MVNSSKILTVSYGTFSCTLEGFDDSFETMKAIAEYFRDLAADDRYFGAEPPTPDAEMLARFAEHRITADASIDADEDSIVVRSDDAATAPATEAAPTHTDKTPDTSDTSPEPDLDSVMAYESEPPLASPEISYDETVEEQPQPAMPETAMPDAAPAPLNADSVIAKLHRLRSVVSQAHQPDAGEDYIEDEHAQDFLGTTAAELNAALATDDAAELAVGAVDEESEDISATLSLVTGEEDEAMAGESQDIDAMEEIAQFVDSTELSDDIIEQLQADALGEEVTKQYDEENSTVDDLEAREIKETSVDAEPFTLTKEDAIGDEETLQEDKNQANQALFGESDDQDDTQSNLPELSPEDEADLQRELAKVETDKHLKSEAPTEKSHQNSGEATDEAALSDPETVRASIQPKQGERSTDVSRIFEQAGNQLQRSDSSERRSAIQHLRAAVASARAEQKAGGDFNSGVDETPYRDTLDNVVRRDTQVPEAPKVDGAVSERAAPLKLVAEQRIDVADEASQSAVFTGQPAQATEDFKSFARQIGATELPDVLEAAAAYMSDVEGRPQFSRPMLMSKLKELQDSDYSREDGLRSFGQLLRTGKLQKLKGGRFAVTDRTEFRAAARNTG